MEKNIKNQITENGLLMIDNLPFGHKSHNFNIDITLQIYHITKHIKSFHNIYSLSLMDIHHKYHGFIILFDKNSSPEIGDIIKLQTITFIKYDSPNKIILILKYEIIEKKVQLINFPSKIQTLQMKNEKKENNDKVNEKILVQTNDNITKVKKIKLDEFKLNNSYENIKKEKENKLITSVEKDKNMLNKNNNKSTSNLIKPSNQKEKEHFSLFSTLTSFSRNIKIRVKCVKKYPIKHYISRINGLPGKIFCMILSDKEGFEMGASCFNDSVNILYDKIQEGKYYEIKGGYVKLNDRKYSETNSDYKIILERNSIIKEIKDIDDFKDIKCSIVKLNKLEDISILNLINIFGYIINISDVIYVNTKYGEKKVKRVILGDETGYKVELTLWNNFAEIDVPINHFITAKKIRISEYNSIKKLGTLNFSEIIIDDKYFLKEKKEIEKQLKNKNFSFKFYEINFGDFFDNCNYYFIEEILNHFTENTEEKYYKVKCYVKCFIHNDKNYYYGCNLCKKKIVILDKEKYFCDFCNQIIKNPKYFYSFSFTISDPTMDYKIKMFNELGKIFLGYSAEDYKLLIENNDINKLNEIDKKILYNEFYFMLRIKSNVIKDIQLIDLSVIRFEKIEKKIESENIIKLLNELLPFK